MSSKRQSRVGDGGLAGVDGQRQRRHHQAAAEPRRADAGDRGLVLELRRWSAVGRTYRPKSCGAISSSGMRSGPLVARWVGTGAARRPRSSRTTTSTVWPSSSSSGSHSTMLVVNRTRGSSTMATWATTYGGGRSGKPNRWLTVNADSVALPETSRTPMLRLRQYRHTGCGRMDQRLAVAALLDAQHAVTARGPEELVLSPVSSGSGRVTGRTPKCASLSSVFGLWFGIPALRDACTESPDGRCSPM